MLIHIFLESYTSFLAVESDLKDVYKQCQMTERTFCIEWCFGRYIRKGNISPHSSFGYKMKTESKT